MILTTVLVLLGLGLTAAVLLSAASRILYVKEDPRIARVESALAGANCGGCGYPGCAAAAAAVVKAEASATVCVVGGPEIAENVAAIMGLEVEYREPELAFRDCTGGLRAEDVYRYEGAADCRPRPCSTGASNTAPRAVWALAPA